MRRVRLPPRASMGSLIFLFTVFSVSPLRGLLVTWAAEQHGSEKPNSSGEPPRGTDEAGHPKPEAQLSDSSQREDTHVAAAESAQDTAPGCGGSMTSIDPSQSSCSNGDPAVRRRPEKRSVPSTEKSWRQSLFFPRWGSAKQEQSKKSDCKRRFERRGSHVWECDGLEESLARAMEHHRLSVSVNADSSERSHLSSSPPEDDLFPRQPDTDKSPKPERPEGEATSVKGDEIVLRGKKRSSMTHPRRSRMHRSKKTSSRTSVGSASSDGIPVKSPRVEGSGKETSTATRSSAPAALLGCESVAETSLAQSKAIAKGQQSLGRNTGARFGGLLEGLRRMWQPGDKGNAHGRAPRASLRSGRGREPESPEKTEALPGAHEFFTNPQCAERPLPGKDVLDQLRLIRECLEQLYSALRANTQTLRPKDAVYQSAMKDIDFFLKKADELRDRDLETEMVLSRRKVEN